MSKQANRINFTKGVIAGLPIPEKRARYMDEKIPGLILVVLPTGAKAYYFRKYSNGKQQEVKIGSFPEMQPEAARATALRMASEAAEGRDPVAQRNARRQEMTFSELFDWYVENHAKPRTRTAKNIEALYRLHFHPLGKKRLATITRSEVRALHAAIAKKSQKEDKTGHGGANKALNILRAVFSQGIKHELFPGPNPAQGIEPFKTQSRDRRLMPDEVARFLEAVQMEPNATIRDYVLLSLLTGARKANVLAMRWDEIDWKGATWRIPRTKNGTSQTIPLGEEEMEILKRRRDVAGDCQWVLPGGAGHLVDPRKGWLRICDRAGVKDFRVHDLRRTLGSWMINTGSTLDVIGKALNHQSLATTAIYARLAMNPVREAKDKAVAALLEASKKKPQP